jgi:hypothetical protein
MIRGGNGLVTLRDTKTGKTESVTVNNEKVEYGQATLPIEIRSRRVDT